MFNSRIKHKLILWMLALVCTNFSFAQDSGTVTIKAGSKATDVLRPDQVYYFAQFAQGQVHFKDGTSAAASMNYNRLLDELQFITPKGDTLSLDNEQTTRFIAIATDTFYFADGYVRQIRGGSKIKLASKEIWVVSDNKKQGGYNTTSSLAATASKSYFTAGNRTHRINVSEDLVLQPVQHYYLGNTYNRFTIAGKKSLLKLLPKEERRITNFLSDQKIDFRNLKDLEKTMVFLEQL